MEVAASEPRMGAAFLRLPRSGNHHDLGLFGVGPNAAPKSRASASTTSPGRSTAIEDLETARDLLARRRLHRRVRPRRDEERLRHGPRRQRVRDHVDAARREVGRVRRPRAGPRSTCAERSASGAACAPRVASSPRRGVTDFPPRRRPRAAPRTQPRPGRAPARAGLGRAPDRDARGAPAGRAGIRRGPGSDR